MLKFERNHPFLSKWLFTVPGKYQEGERASIGPLLATKLIFPYCQVRFAFAIFQKDMIRTKKWKPNFTYECS